MHRKEQASSRWRRWAALLLVNLLVIILILEIGLRVTIGRNTPPRLFEPDKTLGHFHIPGRSGWLRTGEYEAYAQINSKGLRDREYSYAKPDDVFRILMIGDSFTEGLQVAQDETFEARLEVMLNNSQKDAHIEVINGGVSRYGTDNALLFLQHEGSKYAPDPVI